MEDVRERRLRAGLSQSELARRSGVAQPNIAAYESGRRRPSSETRRRLEEALKPLPSAALAQNRAAVIEVLARHNMTNPRVFGSVAVGQDRPGSDLDLLVEAGAALELIDLIDAGEELQRLLGVHVDLITSRSLRPGHEIAMNAVPV